MSKNNKKYEIYEYVAKKINPQELDEIINQMETANDLIEYSTRTMEEINGFKIDPNSEIYLSKMYPLRIMFDQYQIQTIAEENIGRFLTENEIDELIDIFIDDYPIEIEIFLGELIEKSFQPNQE